MHAHWARSACCPDSFNSSNSALDHLDRMRTSLLRTAPAVLHALTCRRLTCMAVTAKDLRPGRSGPSSGSARLYAAITGFPFPIGPTFARPTYRYEVGHPRVTSDASMH